MYLLDLLTNLLPAPLRSYAKCLYPAAAALVAAGASWVQTGNLSTSELKTIASGAVLALIAFAVPNKG